MLAPVDGLRAQTAGDIMNKMAPKESASYVAGVIEGLAFSRWIKDQPSTKGMKCIYDWYYEGPGKDWEKVLRWFERHPDKPVGGLLYVLIEKECGE